MNKGASISLLVSILLLVLKFVAYFLTNSKAVLSDALESIVNVSAAALALWIIRVSQRPADSDHPYGHGKAEYFSSVFEGALISFAAIIIFFDSIEALVKGHTTESIGVGLALIVGAGVVNALLGIYLIRLGKKVYSPALIASGKHVLSDFYTSIAVVVGLTLVQLTGVQWLDPAAALVVGVFLVITGFKLIRRSIDALMDAKDTELIHKLGNYFTECRTEGIIRIHHTRVVRAGNYHHIDAHVVVPEFWDVTTAHNRTNAFEKKVFHRYEHRGEIHFHIDPCRRVYCHACDVKDCLIRRAPFERLIPFTFEEITSPIEPENLQLPEK
ncbi:MAG TPA: cation diffusion facilitator family transporter [Turneriella sp.]|nr:cation diffusion facilitator family transporter [Turneriella sp.]